VSFEDLILLAIFLHFLFLFVSATLFTGFSFLLSQYKEIFLFCKVLLSEHSALFQHVHARCYFYVFSPCAEVDLRAAKFSFYVILRCNCSDSAPLRMHRQGRRIQTNYESICAIYIHVPLANRIFFHHTW